MCHLSNVNSNLTPKRKQMNRSELRCETGWDEAIVMWCNRHSMLYIARYHTHTPPPLSPRNISMPLKSIIYIVCCCWWLQMRATRKHSPQNTIATHFAHCKTVNFGIFICILFEIVLWPPSVTRYSNRFRWWSGRPPVHTIANGCQNHWWIYSKEPPVSSTFH